MTVPVPVPGMGVWVGALEPVGRECGAARGVAEGELDEGGPELLTLMSIFTLVDGLCCCDVAVVDPRLLLLLLLASVAANPIRMLGGWSELDSNAVLKGSRPEPLGCIHRGVEEQQKTGEREGPVERRRVTRCRADTSRVESSADRSQANRTNDQQQSHPPTHTIPPTHP